MIQFHLFNVLSTNMKMHLAPLQAVNPGAMHGGFENNLRMKLQVLSLNIKHVFDAITKADLEPPLRARTVG